MGSELVHVLFQKGLSSSFWCGSSSLEERGLLEVYRFFDLSFFALTATKESKKKSVIETRVL
jgi:hypothetical protein